MESKVCFKCGESKPLDSFYKHPAMGDGLLGKCKECTKKDARTHYAATRRVRSAYEQKRFQDPKRRAYVYEQGRKHRCKHPERYKARYIVSNAIRDGRLARQPCEVCGAKRSQAHHADYSKPLEVRWLCFQCHREKEHGQEVVVTNPRLGSRAKGAS